MRVPRYLWWMVGLLAGALAACSGGSGSSGFDALAESVAIQQVLDLQECVTRRGLMICPADEGMEPVPATPPVGVVATPSATPTPQPGHEPNKPHIDTAVGGSAVIGCAPIDGSGQCSITLPFAPDGFPPSAEYRVAARTLEEGSRWTIGAALASKGSPSAPNYDGAVELLPSARIAPDSLAVQLAVLVFLQPPTMVPVEVAELAESGADFAFVTAALRVQPAVSADSP